MKEFNLDEYFKNPKRKVVTRDGREVTRILCTDAKSKNYPIVALIKSPDEEEEYPLRYTVNGQYCPGYKQQYDLFFAPERHEGWINIFTDKKFHYTAHARVCKSKEDAEKQAKGFSDYAATIKIEWEE